MESIASFYLNIQSLISRDRLKITTESLEAESGLTMIRTDGFWTHGASSHFDFKLSFVMLPIQNYYSFS